MFPPPRKHPPICSLNPAAIFQPGDKKGCQASSGSDLAELPQPWATEPPGPVRHCTGRNPQQRQPQDLLPPPRLRTAPYTHPLTITAKDQTNTKQDKYVKTHPTPNQTNKTKPLNSQQEAKTHQAAAKEAQPVSAALAAMSGTAQPTLLQVCSNHCNSVQIKQQRFLFLKSAFCMSCPIKLLGVSVAGGVPTISPHGTGLAMVGSSNPFWGGCKQLEKALSKLIK